jgi:hypothetical protein
VALGGSDSSQANAPRPAHARVLSRTRHCSCASGCARSSKPREEDLVVLKDLSKLGSSHRCSTRTFPLSATREAIGYVVSVSVSVHEPLPDRTLAISLDLAPDLSCTDSLQDHCLDVDHQPTDLAVGSSLDRSGPLWWMIKGASKRHQQPPVAIRKFKRQGAGDSDGRPVGSGDASSGGR